MKNKTQEYPPWFLRLQQDNKEFSQLVHDYYKLATMRVMQVLREKYNVPPSDIPTLTLAIFARMLNESCYAVGAAIKNGLTIQQILDEEQLITLMKIIMGEPLDPLRRLDIETDLKKSQQHFREFIFKNASDFYPQKE